jgi:hypothetical protein
MHLLNNLDLPNIFWVLWGYIKKLFPNKCPVFLLMFSGRFDQMQKIMAIFSYSIILKTWPSTLIDLFFVEKKPIFVGKCHASHTIFDF